MSRDRRVALLFSVAAALVWWLLSRGSAMVMIGVAAGSLAAVAPPDRPLRERLEDLFRYANAFALGNLYLSRW